jgi:hypothetical protein
MKKYKNIVTGDTWYAICDEHIKYFDKNPNFKEVKEKNVKKKEVKNDIKSKN